MNEARLEACITCGTQHDVEPYYYEITYSPLWVWLFVFLCGPLPTLLLYRMMRQGHDVEAFFCGRCWARAKYAGYVWPGLVILTILFIVVGFYFSAVYKADGVISYLMIASVVLVLPAFLIRRALLPAVVVANADLVKVNIPDHGIVTLYDSSQGKHAGLHMR